MSSSPLNVLPALPFVSNKASTETVLTLDQKTQRLTAIQHVFHMTIFKIAALQQNLTCLWGLISFSKKRIYNVVFAPINSMMGGGGCQKDGYDEIRAGQAKEIFKRVGGEVKLLKTADNAYVETMVLRSKALKEKIGFFGGSWTKKQVKNYGNCLVITPPKDALANIEWQQFYDQTLNKMMWEEAVELKIKNKPRLFTSKQIEDEVKKLGGTWEKKIIKGKVESTIIGYPSEQLFDGWEADELQEDILQMIHGEQNKAVAVKT